MNSACPVVAPHQHGSQTYLIWVEVVDAVLVSSALWLEMKVFPLRGPWRASTNVCPGNHMHWIPHWSLPSKHRLFHPHNRSRRHPGCCLQHFHFPEEGKSATRPLRSQTWIVTNLQTHLPLQRSSRHQPYDTGHWKDSLLITRTSRNFRKIELKLRIFAIIWTKQALAPTHMFKILMVWRIQETCSFGWLNNFRPNKMHATN